MMEKAKSYIPLHIGLFIFSLGAVFSKFASQQTFLSCGFLLFYGLMLGTGGVYAFLWQQVLKRLPLMTAFSNKAVVVIWGIVWGVLLFGETLTPTKIVGALLTIVGVVVMVNADE